MGLRVVAIDPSSDAPGLAMSDVGYVFDLADLDSCLKVARSSGVSGVVTLAADYPMPVLASLCDLLSLPGPSISAVECATNKRRMRECLTAAGIPGPNSIPCIDLAMAMAAHRRLRVDTIFKPTVSHGGRGVTKVSADADVEAISTAYRRAQIETRGHGILVEEFIDGPEFSVEMLIYRGKTSIVAVTDKVTSGAPYFVEIGHSQPTRLPVSELDTLVQTAEQGAKALGLDNCAGHAEIRLGEQGPRIMEIGARLGGGFIASDLVPRSTGVDLVKATIQVALGESPDLRTCAGRGVAVRFLGFPLGGRVRIAEGCNSACGQPGCVSAEIYVRSGDIVPVLRDSRGRVGHVICEGRDATEAILRAEHALGCLSVVVDEIGQPGFVGARTE